MAKIENKFVISENVAEIILSLLKKYNLEESNLEFISKIKNKEVPNGQKIAFLVRRIAEGRTAQGAAALELQTQLGLPKNKARTLAKELLASVFVEMPAQAAPPPKPTTVSPGGPALPRGETFVAEPEIKKTAPDTYREPVE